MATQARAPALVFVGRAAQLCAAALGGIGFGLFIDEVGTFVTERTDHVYRPAPSTSSWSVSPRD